MTETLAPDFQFYDYHPEPADFYGEVMAGMQAKRKKVSPKFFYDATGSRLFDRICTLPEYYQTRTEMQILRDYASEISHYLGGHCILVEPGSGSSQKVRLLLESLRPSAYLPVDISRDHLIQATKALTADVPWLEVHAICADFTQPLTIPNFSGNTRKVAFFPGSSIGNFEPDETLTFLRNIATMVGRDGGLLIGVDLQNESEVLHAAYNDAQGVTADFNLNLLTRINRELEGDFQTNLFEHQAFYNQQQQRIEMHLVSKIEQSVNVNAHTFEFEKGESIHTENSYKYTVSDFQECAAKVGFSPVKVWTDPNELFSLQYLEVTP